MVQNGPASHAPCPMPWCENIMHINAADWCGAHVVPYSKGGATVFENLRTMCNTCNATMSNQHLKRHTLQVQKAHHYFNTPCTLDKKAYNARARAHFDDLETYRPRLRCVGPG